VAGGSVGLSAKTHITGTPMKFDPQMLRQQMQMNQKP
jgi:hypothetical protein